MLPFNWIMHILRWQRPKLFQFYHLINIERWTLHLGTKLHIRIDINPMVHTDQCVCHFYNFPVLEPLLASTHFIGIYGAFLRHSRTRSYQFIWTSLSFSLPIDCLINWIFLVYAVCFKNSCCCFLMSCILRKIYAILQTVAWQLLSFTSRTVFICMRESMKWEFHCTAF